LGVGTTLTGTKRLQYIVRDSCVTPPVARDVRLPEDKPSSWGHMGVCRRGANAHEVKQIAFDGGACRSDRFRVQLISSHVFSVGLVSLARRSWIRRRSQQWKTHPNRPAPAGSSAAASSPLGIHAP